MTSSPNPEVHLYTTTMNEQPSRADIQAIFKRLSSISTNKNCFECSSTRPTWASIPYGVFLCMECSGVHRSLGVHITFVRSIQLDINWSWLQLRQMQVGGNANATAFFRQHGLITNDTQKKYHSRAANMYKEKLLSLANQAMRTYGTKLHLDDHNQHHHHLQDATSPSEKEVDFFHEHTEAVNGNAPVSEPVNINSALSQPQPINNGNSQHEDDLSGPNVEAALSMSPSDAVKHTEARKSTIGARKPNKPQAKRGKGLGAAKVSTNFSATESMAQQRDAEQQNRASFQMSEKKKQTENDEQKMASMRLAYQELTTVEKTTSSASLSDKEKERRGQMERLGMGMHSANRGVSHSVVSDMQVIQQESSREDERNSYMKPSYRSNKDRMDFMDEYEIVGKKDGLFGMDEGSSFGTTSSGGWSDYGGKTSSSSWGMSSDYGSKTSTWDRDEPKSTLLETRREAGDDRYGRSRKNVPDTGTSTEDAQKKFGNAKSISSDAFFGGGRDMDDGGSSGRFANSSSISSAEYFGRREAPPSYSSQAPDLQDIKNGVRQGVTRVAGKLSNLANGMINSIQDTMN